MLAEDLVYVAIIVIALGVFTGWVMIECAKYGAAIADKIKIKKFKNKEFV